MISENAFIAAAKILNCDIATIKAVAEVESRGSGFLSDGSPVILFEPHKFWQNLVKRGINPKDHIKGNEDILYPKWGTRPYGSVNSQHSRLQKAAKIDRWAALASASWGSFQILAGNFKEAGYTTLQDFINAMYKNEDEHLRAFTYFVLNNGLADELRNKEWAAFAKRYNGASYSRNRYDVKLAKAYNKYSQQK